MCNAQRNFVYSHRLKCNIVNSQREKVPCILKYDILKTVLPALTAVSYQQYLKDKSVMIYFMRDFSFDEVFTLDQHDVIIDLKKQSIESDLVDISMQKKI